MFSMKKTFFTALVLVFAATAQSLWAQNDVFVSKSVLKTAEWAGVKYKDLVKRAASGNTTSIQELFDFARYVDGSEALDHAVTCLEGIPAATDEKVARTIFSLSPNLKKTNLERIQLAQGRTKKANLQKPMQTWAPLTWEVLNGRGLPSAESTGAAAPDQMQGANPSGSLMNEKAATPDAGQATPGAQNQLAPPAGRNQLAPAASGRKQ